jgi:MFS family permease
LFDVLPYAIQALVGVAFAIGFIIGPVTGAAFSAWGIDSNEGNWWFWPAMFSLTLTVINFGFLSVFFKESLPKVNCGYEYL